MIIIPPSACSSQSYYISIKPLPSFDAKPMANLSAFQSDSVSISSQTASPTLSPLQRLGVNPQSQARLSRLLQATGDQPYHAGRLLNGKVYLVTQNDKLFYGWPNALRAIPVTQAMRSRCLNEQLRDYTAENGLHLRIRTKNNQRTSSMRSNLWGLPLPLPHFRQTPAHAWD
jgi:hypothetical protein